MVDTPLNTLLSEHGALATAYTATQPVLLRRAVPVGSLPSSADIEELVNASLLRWPYFTILRDGVPAPAAEVRASRQVGDERVDDFFRPEGVRRHLAGGATLKLSQVEDWHPVTRAQADELRSVFPAQVRAFLFLTPAGRRGMLPHRDGSRVLVIQIEGAKEWHLYHTEGEENPDPGLDVDPASEVATHVLRPGDVLYLPHGYGHAATAVDDTSLHLTFTLIEPDPKALLEEFIREWTGTAGMARLGREHRTLSPAEKVKAVLADLDRYAHGVDAEDLLRRTLARAAQRDER